MSQLDILTASDDSPSSLSKYLYNISEEFKVPHPSLSTVDSRLCPRHKCSNHHSGGRTCKKLRRHRRLCHEESRAVYEGRELPQNESGLGVGISDCKTPRWTTHCECFVVTLYKRLESWMPADLKFCHNCRKFTYRCSRDSRHCGMNARRAAFDFRERELWKWKQEEIQRVVYVGWEERGLVTVAGSSQMGAAVTLSALTRMRETRELMQRERREEMLKMKEEMKRKEEELRKMEKQLKERERELRKREEELWRRRDKLSEVEGKIRKREDQVRKMEEEMGKKGRSNKEEKRARMENKKGFARCPCKEP
jgi:hypothetical protein